MRKKSPFEVKDPLPRDFEGWFSLVWEKTLCKMGRHSAKDKQEHKFNGGNTCWLCKYCRLIVRYDSEDSTKL